MAAVQVMEVGETDLNNLLIDHSGKAISMNFIRYIWEQVRLLALRPSPGR